MWLLSRTGGPLDLFLTYVRLDKPDDYADAYVRRQHKVSILFFCGTALVLDNSLDLNRSRVGAFCRSLSTMGGFSAAIVDVSCLVLGRFSVADDIA